MNFFAGLTPYKLVIEIIVLGALAAGAMVGVHLFLEHERDIGRAEVQARWDKQIADDKESARLRTAALVAQRDTAVDQGAKREDTIRTLAATVATTSGGMRDAVTKINSGMPDYSTDALRAVTRTYGDLLAECQGRRGAVAEEAERLNSEKRTLIEAWPQSPPLQ